MKTKIKTLEFKKSVLFIFISCIFVFTFSTSYSQEEKKRLPIELSAAYGMLIYQSGYGMDNSYGIELIAGKFIKQLLKTEGGIRIGLKPLEPDVFIRLSGINRFGYWNPVFGIETGYSNRMYFDGNSNLLKETRDAMTTNTGHFYLSSHTEILSFELKNHWSISFLELDFGTHFKDFGTTVRLQTNFVRIRKTL